jgi:hypothetical protein
MRPERKYGATERDHVCLKGIHSSDGADHSSAGISREVRIPDFYEKLPDLKILATNSI